MLAFALKQEADNQNKEKAPKRNYNKPPLCMCGKKAYAPLAILKYSHNLEINLPMSMQNRC